MNSLSSDRGKECLCSFSLVKKISSNPILGLIIKRVKLKYNNEFINKLMNMRAQINYI